MVTGKAFGQEVCWETVTGRVLGDSDRKSVRRQ